MDIAALLDDKSVRSLEKRERIADAMRDGMITVKEIGAFGFDGRKTGLILEAMEAVSRDDADIAGIEWLNYAEPYISSESNNLKREASRVVGNIAHLFPDNLDSSIERLMENTKNDGAVVRWGSAYALGRIITIPKYANSDLFDVLAGLAEKETENGVKNQYMAGIKKAKKMRR